jgi:hypothetical protein
MAFFLFLFIQKYYFIFNTNDVYFLLCHLRCRGSIWEFKFCIVVNDFSNEALLIEIYVGAAFHNLSSDIPTFTNIAISRYRCVY